MEMTIKDLHGLQYSENSYGVYRFKIDDKSVLNSILNINERYPDDTMVAVNTNVYDTQNPESMKAAYDKLCGLSIKLEGMKNRIDNIRNFVYYDMLDKFRNGKHENKE